MKIKKTCKYEVKEERIRNERKKEKKRTRERHGGDKWGGKGVGRVGIRGRERGERKQAPFPPSRTHTPLFLIVLRGK